MPSARNASADGGCRARRGPLRVVYHEAYSAPLPCRHRFPMDKFRTLYERLRAAHIIEPGGVHRAEPASRTLLEHAHDRRYVDGVLARTLEAQAVRRIGFPLTPQVVERSRAAVGGTLLAARLALEHGVAINLAGGSHHAFHDHGAGFCVFNDVAVASRALLSGREARRILVVDLDVHQGDGTAAIFAGTAEVLTFSMHAARNFPARKARSDRDVPLADGTGDAAYLECLEREIAALLTRHEPELVFYNAGVDPHRDDRLGRLALSSDGLRQRDRIVLGRSRAAGAAVAGVLGGGYARDLDALVALHALLFEEAVAVA